MNWFLFVSFYVKEKTYNQRWRPQHACRLRSGTSLNDYMYIANRWFLFILFPKITYYSHTFLFIRSKLQWIFYITLLCNMHDLLCTTIGNVSLIHFISLIFQLFRFCVTLIYQLVWIWSAHCVYMYFVPLQHNFVRFMIFLLFCVPFILNFDLPSIHII